MADVEYREPTPEELASTSFRTPRQLDKRVRVKCLTGVCHEATIEFEDGGEIYNVLRAVIAMEGGPETVAKVFITRFHHEIGRVVYEEALAIVG